jgi:hypothetical protein
MGEIVHYQIQIAVMMDLGLKTPSMMNLSENWVILVRILVCPLSPQFGNNVSTVEELTDEELAYLRHYALKVETHMTNDTFSKLAFAFPESTIASWKITKARAEFLATFRPVAYDCCISSCCCFVGPNNDLAHCPYCHEPRFNSKGRARRRFTYAPLIPRLKAFYQNKEFGHSMLYRSKYQHDGTSLQDVMDGANYQRLRETNVTINNQPRPYKYFEDHRDIALGLSTDGFCPFRNRKKTCWPILIYNYNLSPEIRFWIRHILCVGVVPGPYKPKDFDSFLWPLVEELLKLGAGIKAFDLSSDEIFALRAFLILVFGDIPAVSMVMRMKGHNGLVPCRMCKITALRTPNSRSPGHYVPLHRARHPAVKNNNTVTHVYDPANLPLRTHADFLDTARAVQMAPTTAQSNILAKNSGVKGIPILSYLPSLFFPYSFPYDFMHLIFENVMKNLILLWTGEFKGLDEGTGQYHLMPKVWEAVGTATATSDQQYPLHSVLGPQISATIKWHALRIRGHFGCCTLVQFFSRNDFNDGFTSTTLLNSLNSFASVSSLTYLQTRFQLFEKAFKTGFSNMNSKLLVLSMGL